LILPGLLHRRTDDVNAVNEVPAAIRTQYNLVENLVDPVDILLGKLFSRREKDLDDLRATIPLIGKSAFAERFHSAGGSLLSDPNFKQNAERNWYILFGRELGTP
jgi:hypothetical protein